MDAWPHQQKIVAESLAAIERGVRRNLVMCGTGGGKTWCMATLADHYRKLNLKVAVYTNRKMLLSQMSDAFTRFGVPHGVRAAGYLEDHDHLVQICSLQTENVRTNKKMIQDLHDAKLVLCDEAHVLKGDSIRKILDEHVEADAFIVGFTATPIDLEDWYDSLIVAGQPSELRACGAVVPALHYGPDEPDLKALKKLRKMNAEGEDFSENQVRSAMMTPTLFGRVSTWFHKLNPEHKPTLLFAPGVDESLWFAEQFTKAGIPAAHIDGDRIWLNGSFLSMGTDETKRKSRELVLKMSRRGDVRVMCNRYVCLDAETEILTTEGWVGMDAMTDRHEVANWADGRVHFAPPKGIVRRRRQPGESMIVLETPRRSIRVTASHQMLYRTSRGGKFSKCCAGLLANRSVAVPVSGYAEPLKVSPEQPKAHPDFSRRVTSNAHAMRKRGYPPDKSVAEAKRRILDRERLRYKIPSELTLSECELIGFWMGDGNKNKLSSGGIEYRMWQGVDCPKIIDRVEHLLHECCIDFVRRSNITDNSTEVIQWSMPRGTGFGDQKRRGVFHLEPYLNKDGSSLLWGLSGDQFDSLIRGLWMADGYPHGNSTEPTNRLMICGARPKQFDFLQGIAVCHGYRASVRNYKQSNSDHRLHLLTLTKTDEHRLTKYRFQVEDGWTDEEVWCVETESGNIITRRRGSVTVMGNCREGLDLPWIRHIIAATMFGAIQSYIQSIGRGGRADRDPESIERWGPKTSFTVQDHGSNWWRCGSINADREWNLNYTAGMIYGLRAERIRTKKEAAPHRCRDCGRIFTGSKCACGWVPGPRRSRPVVTTDGELREMVGDIFPPRRIATQPSMESSWVEMYFRSKAYKKGRTFRAAKALFAYENGFTYPNPAWKFMPIEEVDEFRLVRDVPRERLR